MQTLTEKKKQFTRDAIVEVAREIFSHRGYHNTQVMDIVKSVGMSAGTFYIHFKDKRDLFAQITRQSFSELRAKIKDVRVRVNIWDRADRLATLRETFAEYFDYIEANRQQYLILHRGGYGVDEEFDDDVWTYFSDITQDLAEDIRGWMDMGVIEGANPATMACAVVGMTMNLGHSYLMGNEFTRGEAIETLSTTSNLLFESFLTEAGRKALKEKKKTDRRKADAQR
jgi:AcrR family transcriptional regulator